MSVTNATVEPISRFVSAPDGLSLHVADYRADAAAPRVPVVCLAGLTRNGRDFGILARHLVKAGHRVLAPDYRGRGLSERDKDPRRYDLAIEREDILAVLTALEVERAAFVGTSRGGLHLMGLAAVRPTLIAAAILNDIGPIVDTQGLIKIKLRVASRADPANWSEATQMLKMSYGTEFPGLEAFEWAQFAHAAIREQDDRLFWDFDPALTRSLDAVSSDLKPLDLWPQFEALATVPILAIRGALSDILSAETFAQMRARTPACESFEVADQGHAPLLFDNDSCEAIVRFLARVT